MLDICLLLLADTWAVLSESEGLRLRVLGTEICFARADSGSDVGVRYLRMEMGHLLCVSVSLSAVALLHLLPT